MFDLASRCKDLYKIYPPVNPIQQEEMFNIHEDLAKRVDPESAKTFQGFCEIMMRTWFRRISKGKLTWNDSKHAGASHLYDPKSERWKKKFETFYRMQTGNSNGQISPMKAPNAQDVMPDRRTAPSMKQYYQSASKNEISLAEATTMRDAILAARIDDDLYSQPGDSDIFLHVSLRGRVGGHAVGIHLSTTPFQAPVPLADDPEWHVISEQRMSDEMIHFFDPNIGEFFIDKDSFPHFFKNIFNNVYSTFIRGRWFDSITVTRYPVFWNEPNFGTPAVPNYVTGGAVHAEDEFGAEVIEWPDSL